MAVHLRKYKKTKVWLVTWETMDGTNPVAFVLSPRTSPERVKEAVERYYAQQSYSVSEQVEYAAARFNPYPANYGTLKRIPWQGQIYCGHNPFLFARKVTITGVVEDTEGRERLTWDEMPTPSVEHLPD